MIQSGSNPKRNLWAQEIEKSKLDPGVQLMSLGVCLCPSGALLSFMLALI